LPEPEWISAVANIFTALFAAPAAVALLVGVWLHRRAKSPMVDFTCRLDPSAPELRLSFTIVNRSDEALRLVSIAPSSKRTVSIARAFDGTIPSYSANIPLDIMLSPAGSPQRERHIPRRGELYWPDRTSFGVLARTSRSTWAQSVSIRLTVEYRSRSVRQSMITVTRSVPPVRQSATDASAKPAA
jgi:hypothetical protein